MQGLKTAPTGMRTAARGNRLPLLALSVLLTACHAPQAESADTSQPRAENTIATTAPAAEPTPAAGDQAQAVTPPPPASAATEAPPQIDADGNPYRPDDSYNRANLRPQYRQCVAASGADLSALRACMDEEFQWQDERLRLAWVAIANGPDSSFKDRLADEQHIYMRDTYQKCHYDPITKDQNQLIAAQPCLTNRYANRSAALEALTHNAPM